MIRVYIAGKIDRAAEFRLIRDIWREEGIEVCSTWLDQAHLELNGTPTPSEFRVHWLNDEEDVKSANVLVLYGAGDDRLRGGLIEAGIAIAMNIPVIVIGNHHDYGTWQHHVGVLKAEDFDHAKSLILLICRRMR